MGFSKAKGDMDFKDLMCFNKALLILTKKPNANIKKHFSKLQNRFHVKIPKKKKKINNKGQDTVKQKTVKTENAHSFLRGIYVRIIYQVHIHIILLYCFGDSSRRCRDSSFSTTFYEVGPVVLFKERRRSKVRYGDLGKQK